MEQVGISTGDWELRFAWIPKGPPTPGWAWRDAGRPSFKEVLYPSTLEVRTDSSSSELSGALQEYSVDAPCLLPAAQQALRSSSQVGTIHILIQVLGPSGNVYV